MKKSNNSNARGLLVTRRRVLALGAGGLALPFIGSASAKTTAVNVGVILPLSGANAQFGINSRNGIELVAEQINARGGIKSLGGAPINLVIADSTSAPATAATVGQRLITQNDVVAILGAYASSLSLALSEVTERRDTPLLTMSFSDEITGRGFKNVFQVIAKASALGAAQLEGTIDIAKSAGVKLERIAVMYEDTAYGVSQAKGLREAAGRLGIKVVMDEAYPLGITDVTPLINKLRATDAQAVFPASYLNDGLQIIRSMRQQKISMPIIGGAGGYVIPDFRKALGEYAENVLSIAPGNYDLAPQLTDAFRKKYGYFMVHEALEHAVCLEVLAQALEVAKVAEPAAVRKALSETEFKGGWCDAMPGGVVKFDATGLNTHAVPMMVQWHGENLATVWPNNLAKSKAVWAAA